MEESEAARQAEVGKWRESIEQQIWETMEAAKHLPKDAHTAKLVLGEVRRNVEEGRPFDVKDLVERVDRAAGVDMARRLQALGVERVRAHLPPEWLAAFRDADVAAYKSGHSAAPPPTAKPAPSAAPPEVANSLKLRPKGQGLSEAELIAELKGLSYGQLAARAAAARKG